MTAQKLTRMAFNYLLDSDPEREQHVEVHNRSLIAWDETRGKRKWPSASDAPFLWQTFIVWHHLNRTGAYVLDFKTFQDDCAVLEAEEDEVEVDPTRLTATPGSSSPSD